MRVVAAERPADFRASRAALDQRGLGHSREQGWWHSRQTEEQRVSGGPGQYEKSERVSGNTNKESAL